MPEESTSAQVAAARKIYAGPKNPRTGEQIYSPLYPGSELGWAQLAGGAEPLFQAVATEVQALLGADTAVIVRFEDDDVVTTLGIHSGYPLAGTRRRLDPRFAIGMVRSTGRAARFETDDPTAADMPAVVRENLIRSAVASPIRVEGDLWGAICVATYERSLTPGTARRLDDFTELVATAIVNADSRDALARLAEEQAALRRVATLVARDAPPGEVFDAAVDLRRSSPT